MPRKKYIVTLTETERQHLEKLTQTGKATAYIITHARILLKADTDLYPKKWTGKLSCHWVI